MELGLAIDYDLGGRDALILANLLDADTSSSPLTTPFSSFERQLWASSPFNRIHKELSQALV